MTIQEIYSFLQEIINSNIIASNFLLESPEFAHKDVVEQFRDETIPTALSILNAAYIEHLQVFQMLAYIINYHFDGKYVMTDGEMNSAFNDKTFTLRFIRNQDEGFLEIISE